MRTIDVLRDLLDCVQCDLDPPVCRAFIHPGPEAPHDVCESGPGGSNGQVWVGVTATTEGFPFPTPDPTTCRSNWTDFIEVGIVRCAKGTLTDDMDIPDANLITEDAIQQLADRDALRDAILCCLGLDGKDLLIEAWTPIPPQGGCVGGTWTFRSKDAGCTCNEEL